MQEAPLQLDYSGVMRRIVRVMGGYALLGVGVFGVLGGGTGVVSFLGGAAVSGLSFYLLHRLVVDVGAAAEGRKVRTVSVLVHALRMVVLGGAAYAIVRSYGSDRPAFIAGLLLAVVSATFEVLIELYYARA